MKIKDFYDLDDNIEHFVIHIAQEEFPAVEIKKVEIKKGEDSIIFNFYVDRNDNKEVKGLQKDLSAKLEERLRKYHKNYVKNVIVNVIRVV